VTSPSFSPPHRRLGYAAAFAILLGGCASGGNDGAGPAAENAAPLSPFGFQNANMAEAPASAASGYGNYLAGLQASKHRDMETAAHYIGAALARDPKNPELLRQAFLLSAGTGDMTRAGALARRMKDGPVNLGSATVLRILDSIRADDFAQARKTLAELPGRGLGQLLRPLLSAWLTLAEGAAPDAVEGLEGLNGIDGIDVLRQVHSGLIHDLAGRPGDARRAFDDAMKDPAALSLRLAWLAANFYVRHDDKDKAQDLMRRYLETNPQNSSGETILARLEGDTPAKPLVASAEDGLAEALFNVAGLLSQQNAHDLALLYARLSLYMRPGFDFGQMLLGEILQGQGRSDAAIRAYRGVPAESPFAYTARLRVSGELQELDRADEAIALLEEVAAAHPTRFEPLYRIGNIHRGGENFEQAVGAYRRALARLEATSPQHWSLHYFLGIALERTDRWSEAEQQFKTALELNPEQPYVMNYLAYSWVEQEINLDKAEAMLRRAVDQRPDDGFIVDSMGWVYYRLGDYEKAVDFLERAVELRPNDPVINDHLGDAYWKVGRRQEARFQWHRALGLDPEDDVLSRIQVKLDRGLDAADQPNG
jgi:tetratricopeptide (TPR) repeat protein